MFILSFLSLLLPLFDLSSCLAGWLTKIQLVKDLSHNDVKIKQGLIHTLLFECQFRALLNEDRQRRFVLLSKDEKGTMVEKIVELLKERQKLAGIEVLPLGIWPDEETHKSNYYYHLHAPRETMESIQVLVNNLQTTIIEQTLMLPPI